MSEPTSGGNPRDAGSTEGKKGERTEVSIRTVVHLTDYVYWVQEWPDKPTWRDRIRRYFHPEHYIFDRSAAPTKPWVDRPAGPYERSGWRIRAAYVGSDLAFEVEYVVCALCKVGWVELPHSYEGYMRQGLASGALRALPHTYPGVEWHTAGGHFRESRPFWDSVSKDIPGGYTQRSRCLHVEPWKER